MDHPARPASNYDPRWRLPSRQGAYYHKTPLARPTSHPLTSLLRIAKKLDWLINLPRHSWEFGFFADVTLWLRKGSLEKIFLFTNIDIYDHSRYPYLHACDHIAYCCLSFTYTINSELSRTHSNFITVDGLTNQYLSSVFSKH